MSVSLQDVAPRMHATVWRNPPRNASGPQNGDYSKKIGKAVVVTAIIPDCEFRLAFLAYAMSADVVTDALIFWP